MEPVRWRRSPRGVAVLVGLCLMVQAGSAAPAGAESHAASDRVEADLVGLYDPLTATWYLPRPGDGTASFEFGPRSRVPLLGDWNGDGIDSPGVYDPASGAFLWVDDPLGGGLPGLTRLAAGGVPVAGDPDGSGRDRVGVMVGGVMTGLWEGTPVPFGATVVLAADLDGDGADELVFRVGEEWRSGGAPVPLPGIGEGERALLGDWSGDGRATLGVFRPRNAEFWLYRGENVAAGVTIFPYGSSRMVPVAGRFGTAAGTSPAPPRVIEIPPLGTGDEGAQVVRLQTALADHGLYRGRIDGRFGPATAYAVMAFHKAAGRERTWSWERGDTDLLASFQPEGFPDRPAEPDRIEVDLDRQIMAVFIDHRVEALIPVSTGGGHTYFSKRAGRRVVAATPRGDFTLLRYTSGWSCDPLYGWCIYRAWNFTSAYAIHGYNSVPAQPASHGCIRIPNWEADAMAQVFYVGMPVHVWDRMPVEAAEPAASGRLLRLVLDAVADLDATPR